MSRRKNPRRIPVSMSKADIDKLVADVTTGAIADAYTVFFTALLDKEGMSVKDLQRIFDEVEELSKSLTQKYCTLADMRNVLKEEAGIGFGSVMRKS